MKFRVTATFEFEVDEADYADMTVKEAKAYEEGEARKALVKNYVLNPDATDIVVEIISK